METIIEGEQNEIHSPITVLGGKEMKKYDIPWQRWFDYEIKKPFWTLKWDWIRSMITYNVRLKCWEAELWPTFNAMVWEGYDKSWTGLKSVNEASLKILNYLKDIRWKPPKGE